MTRNTTESVQDQLTPRPMASNRSCQRSSTHETATYKKLSTQILLGRGARANGVRGINAGRDRVVPPGVERMAAQEPAQREPAAAQRAETLDRLDGVGTATRHVPARRWPDRADGRAIE